MKRDYGGVGTAAQRANTLLSELSIDIECQREQNDSKDYYLKYTRNGAANLPKLTRRIVEQSINDLEANGYEFSKKTVGNVQQYELNIQNVIDIYHHRKFPKYRELHEGPFVIYISNLKGGASKTVSTVTLAHGLRVHEDLLRYDLRILVISIHRRQALCSLIIGIALGPFCLLHLRQCSMILMQNNLKKTLFCLH